MRTIEEGFTKSQGLKPLFGESDKFEGEKTQEKMLESKAKSDITWADLMREGTVVAGTPSQVTEQLEEVVRTLHVGHLMLLNQFGSIPHEMAKENIIKTGQEVLPNLKHIWDEEGWKTTGGPRAWGAPPRRRPRSSSSLCIAATL